MSRLGEGAGKVNTWDPRSRFWAQPPSGSCPSAGLLWRLLLGPFSTMGLVCGLEGWCLHLTSPFGPLPSWGSSGWLYAVWSQFGALLPPAGQTPTLLRYS